MSLDTILVGGIWGRCVDGVSVFLEYLLNLLTSAKLTTFIQHDNFVLSWVGHCRAMGGALSCDRAFRQVSRPYREADRHKFAHDVLLPPSGWKCCS